MNRKLVLAVVLGLAPLAVIAQEEDQASPPEPRTERLVVRQAAIVEAAADEVEIELVVLGAATEGKDAERKHRERLDRLMAALTGRAPALDETPSEEDGGRRRKSRPVAKEHEEEAPPPLDVPGKDGLVYSVREGAFTIGLKGKSPRQDDYDYDDDIIFFPGNDPKKKKEEGEVMVASSVHVTLKNLERVKPSRIAKLIAHTLDRAKAAKAEMTSGKTAIRPKIRFRSKQADELLKRANGEAISRGRARAQQLAAASGRKLGKLTVVRTVDSAEVVRTQERDGLASAILQLATVDAGAGDLASPCSQYRIEVVLDLEFDFEG